MQRNTIVFPCPSCHYLNNVISQFLDSSIDVFEGLLLCVSCSMHIWVASLSQLGCLHEPVPKHLALFSVSLEDISARMIIECSFSKRNSELRHRSSMLFEIHARPYIVQHFPLNKLGPREMEYFPYALTACLFEVSMG